MKNGFLNVAVYMTLVVLSTACNYSAQRAMQVDQERLDYSLIQTYEGESTADAESEFGVINRTIEFEYFNIALDSVAEVVIRITTGFNEGELVKELDILTIESGLKSLNSESVVSREYVEEYSYSTTRPVMKYKTIKDPGGVDVVVQADGTHKHVHRAPSSKTVNVTENEVTHHTQSNSQLYNEMKITLDQEGIDIFRDMDNCVLHFENCTITIWPANYQLDELRKYF